MSRAIDCLIDPAGCTVNRRVERVSAHGAGSLLTRGLLTLSRWSSHARQRRELRRLADNPDLLRDTGLTRDEVRRAARMPFWRA